MYINILFFIPIVLFSLLAMYAIILLNNKLELARNELEKAKRTDSFTGLPNKNSLKNRVKDAVRKVTRQKKLTVFFYLDLDNFKALNEATSHDKADVIMLKLIDAYKKTLRDADTIFRVGGDEFVVQADVDCIKGADEVKQKLIRITKAQNVKFSYLGKNYQLGVSVGYTAVYAASSPETIIELADIDMKRMKKPANENDERFKSS